MAKTKRTSNGSNLRSVPSPAEQEQIEFAERTLHELKGTHQFEFIGWGRDNPDVTDDPGGECWRCRICGETKWNRGPGY